MQTFAIVKYLDVLKDRLAGLLVGLPVTFFAARFLRSQLFEMNPFDPIIFSAATMGIAMFLVVTICKYAFKLEVLDEFNDAGTMGAFGFLGAYFFIAVAAPVFLKKRNELKGRDVALCVAAVVLMLIPAVGSVYPVPPAPVKYFPYIFLAYLVIGAFRVVSLRFGAPQRLKEISEEVHAEHISGMLAAQK